MHPIEAFIRNPVKVAVGVLMLALFGTIALMRMPMQLTPEVEIPTVSITTRWPGASPQEVEREIIQEQEEQLKSVEGVTKMTSECKDSEGVITLEFRVGANMEETLLKVNSRLQQVSEYPEDADEPVIATSSAADQPIAWFILAPRMASAESIRQFQSEHPELAESLEQILNTPNRGLAGSRLKRLAAEHPEVGELLPPDIDVTKLRKFAEDMIEAQLERVPGVSNSNVMGGQDPELQVLVDPQKLAARRLTVQNVRQALRDQNKDTSGGDFWEGKRRYVVRTLGQFRSPEQVERQILAIDGDRPVYVRDVAEVRMGYKKPDGFVRRFGIATLAINAQRDTGANVLDVMHGLREEVRRLNDGILKDRGLELTQVYDETEYIYSAVGLVNQNIVVGGLLTIGVLLLFLRSGRSTLVIGLAIPTSIIGTFLVLHWLGRSLNVISLAGLAFAVGMLVDNAVVVLENIYRHYQSGDRPFAAAERGTKEVWGAVVASTLTTLAVFLPVLFIQEEAGQLFRDIALAISSAVGLSLIISVTLIPTAAARLLRKQTDVDRQRTGGTFEPSAAGNDGEHQAVRPVATRQAGMIRSVLAPLDTFGEGFVNGIVRINDWVQRGLLRRVTVAAILVGGAAFFTFALWPKLEYLPNGNRNLVFGIVLPPPGYNLDELMQIGELVEDELRPYVEVDPDSEQAEQLDYPPIADFFYVARGRQVFVGLRAVDPMRAGELVPLVANLRTKLPGTYVVASQSSLFQRGLNAGRSIDIEITGPELTKLVEIGGQIMGQVTPVLEPEKFTGDAPVTPPQTQTRPLPSLDLSNPEVQLTPKLVQAAEMGVSATDLGYAVDALVDGAYVTDYFIGGDKIDLVVMGNEIYASRTQDLESLPVATPLSEFPVRLDSLAEVRLSAGPEQINHRERLRAITIQVTPPPNMALEDAIERIHAKILDPLRASGQLGSQYTINLSGTADKLRQTWLSMRWILVLALLVTYLLMAALFESWIHPLVIILSVPLGAVGGVLGLKLLVLYQLFTQNVLGFNPQPLQTLDVLTMLGFVILIGTVVNNAILIVHQSLNHMRLDGMMPRPAILESVRTRIRPIFMTTLTTVFGLAPLVFFPGAGSELYRGLGSVVLGGLIVSTIFTLVLVPTMFSLMLDLGEFTRRMLGQTTESHEARSFEEPFLAASAVDGESAEDEGEQSDSDLEPEPQREPELQPEPDSQLEPESASKRGPK